MQTFLLHAGGTHVQLMAEQAGIQSGTQLPEAWPKQVVIQWGLFADERENQRLDCLKLQPAEAIKRAQDPRRRDELLSINGIKTLSSHSEPQTVPYFPYQYKIPVFHLQSLAIYEKKKKAWTSGQRRKNGVPELVIQEGVQDGYTEIGTDQSTFHIRRAARESVKAIYALGLDFGVVTVGVLPSGHTLVLHVEPLPRLTRRLCQLFARAIQRYDAELTRELARTEPVMLGSDPEFLLLSAQGKVVAASRFLEREGPVGCDAIVLSGHRVILPLAELRPQPSVDPRQLARNLHHTMQLAARAIPDESLAWLSGGMPLRGFPLGGHIHFSRLWLNGHMLRALDNYLALPLMQIEGETTGQRRPRYGGLGDFRPQPHGGFEYRTLPSWLVSPAVTRGVLSLAALIAEHYWSLRRQPLRETDVQAAYYRGDKEQVRSLIAQLWEDLERLPGYSRHAGCLEPLKAMIVRMEPWNERADFRKAWKIAPYQPERLYQT
ncbi:hypothetical protein [Paenibacillus sp. GP183]|uniref:putative amidoligase domain-containing protein n=1 Tax=Paenibacillus sp. GP183 TaxID=1882751 RepID=UPI00089C7C35|nr:hypothetical protein [Paenibacillus sp. GP183]SEB59998.1 Phage phiEco32-like COOH.NH2 ligase-type 2 [Paenibacillus sp. GP183]